MSAFLSRDEWKLVHGEQLDAWVEQCVAKKLKQGTSDSPPTFDELMILRLECLAEYEASRR